MGNESSQMSGLDIEERAIEVTDHWTLYSATLNTASGETKLSIFQGEPVVQGQLWANSTPLEKAAKNLMLHRHPCILKYVSSWHKGSAYYLTVESVKPLELNLQVQTNIQICLGLRNIVRALVFLHEQAKSYHNNVCISSIYVTENGSWKLGGLEYLIRIHDMTQEYLIKSRPHRYAKSIDPNESKNNGKGCDQYALATLVSEVLKTKQDDDLIGISDFKTYCSTQLKHPNVDMRPTLSALLLHPFFNNEFILIHSFLSELPLKSNEEKAEFFTKLPQRLRLFDESETASNLGELLISRMVLLDTTAQEKFLPFLFRPNSEDNAEGLFSESTFQKIMAPKLLHVFSVRDLQIRLVLLHHFSFYLHLFSKTDLADHILPELLVGIKDTNDQLVAITLRALAELVPVLGSTTVVGGNRGKLFTDGRPKQQLNKTNNIILSHAKSKPILEEGISDKNSLKRNNELILNDTTYTLTERLSPDGGEDVNTIISQNNLDVDEWSDWEDDAKSLNSSTANDLTILPLNSVSDNSVQSNDIKYKVNVAQYNDITDLDIKVQKAPKVNAENEIDFFRDMEPVIEKSNVFLIDEVNNKNIADVSSNKFEITSVNVQDDGWDDALSDWSEQ